jgi:hypothetical protein
MLCGLDLAKREAGEMDFFAVREIRAAGPVTGKMP